MEKAIEKAKILMQAMPYIKEYRGRKVLIKFGGKAMQDKEMERSIAGDLVMMRYVGLYPIVVHGGGPEISKYMQDNGLEPKFVDGLRVTDEKTMEIVKRVLVSKINKEITENINIHGELATSVAGDDCELITAEKMNHSTVDLGFVGTVKDVKASVIEDIIKEEKIPVIASIGKDTGGNSYNINADSVASALASALSCEKIIFLTNVNGIYGNLGDDKSLISALDYKDGKQLIDKNTLSKGMLPKVLSSIRALENGVHRAHILNGTIKHALLLEIFTDEGIGTMISSESEAGVKRKNE